MGNHTYHEVLSYLKDFGGEKYKKLDKCKSEQEKEYMEKGAESGKSARSAFTDLVEKTAVHSDLNHGKITQWQNSGNFVSYFWCQLKMEEFLSNNISLSLFAEKAEDTYRYRVSVELAIDSSSTEEKDNYRKILDIPLKEGLVYVSGGNNENEFRILDEVDNEKVKQSNLKKVQVSKIINESDWDSDDELKDIVFKGISDLMQYYEYAVRGVRTSDKQNIPIIEKSNPPIDKKMHEVYSPGFSTKDWLTILLDS